MLQQPEPEYFVIASGVQHSVREFVNAAAASVGIKLEWSGEGDEELGVVRKVSGKYSFRVKPGSVIVRVDPVYFRPAEVDSLLGDSSYAKAKLGWKPKVTFEQLVDEMVRADLDDARRDEMCIREGYRTFQQGT